MHGRPRQPYGVPEEPRKLEARRKKFEQLKQLTDRVLHNILQRKNDQESLALSAMLLKKNPDVYTVWNNRKEVLQELLEGKEGREQAKEVAAQELAITEAALLENPKSYYAWFHRLWIVRTGLLPLDNELKNVNSVLRRDARNFTAWKYRREIVKLEGTDLEDELAYSRQLIDADFSNYSAWHARAALLIEIHSSAQVISLQDLVSNAAPVERKAIIPLHALDKEFQLAQSCFFTEPQDQSAYFYHKWLLKELVKHAYEKHDGAVTLPTSHKAVMDRLEKEEQSCRELLETERRYSEYSEAQEQLAHDRPLQIKVSCKWPLQSLASILCEKRALGCAEHNHEITQLYKELIDRDPQRAGYYVDAIAHL